MKSLSKLLLLLFVSVMLERGDVVAQDYTNGIGIRLGGLTSGLNFKHKLSSGNAIEGIATFGYRSILLTGLYEVHKPIASTNGLHWYYGFGGHLGAFGHRGGYWIYKERGNRIYVADPGATIVVPGVDFILGIEYKFINAPFSVGIDLKPFVDIRSVPYAYMDGALNLRIVF
ncbi:MAG: hypothetical protein EYC69_05440 [Bacteroidetes bacterium]|nr:MAG: hypothetical protein EYC69_05440 [Bacteroidota bacterium]